jgi:hypothetical protein
MGEVHASGCACADCELGLNEQHSLGCPCDACHARRERLMRQPPKDSILGILIDEQRKHRERS